MPAPETITAFTRRLKTLIEGDNPLVILRGEISNLRTQSSGHHYFSLKDPGAQIGAVLFRGDAIRQQTSLRDGMQVIATGQISLYEARGQYQIIVRHLIEDGIGRLQREFEALKRRLAEEGLFDPEKRKTIPASPRTVGIITSPTGAAIRDILRIITRRGWRGRAIVFPAKVQGVEAAAELSRQIRFANSLSATSKIPHPDLLVLARGGGSIEDLWPFNEETLVRAVAASEIPIISAVGHETDITLSDFAADLRAETPSAAAEYLTSSYIAQVEACTRLAASLYRESEILLENLRERVSSLRKHLRLLSPARQVETMHLTLDDLRNRLSSAAAGRLQEKRHQLAQAFLNLRQNSPEHLVQLHSHKLLSLYKRLESANPANILKRGYTIVRDADGKPLATMAQAAPHKNLNIQFNDGTLPVSKDPLTEDNSK